MKHVLQKMTLFYFLNCVQSIPHNLEETITAVEPSHPIDPIYSVEPPYQIHRPLPIEEPMSPMDSHNCCVSCGYSYCKTLDSCVRPWETYCVDFNVIVNPFLKTGH